MQPVEELATTPVMNPPTSAPETELAAPIARPAPIRATPHYGMSHQMRMGDGMEGF
jgi:hypothetical protein